MKPFYEHAGITIYHGDCREILPTLPPVDLVLTDPPYGIGADKAAHKASGDVVGHGHRRVAKRIYPKSDWDKSIEWEILWQLLRHGKHACCWGGNYYPFPPSSSWLVWDKENAGNNFADCELAWTNYGGAIRLRRHL